MFARAFGLCVAVAAAVVFLSASSAATAKVGGGLTTRAAVVHYLRSTHMNLRGVVIERGLRNYAGANCPGTGWTCTTATHPVVQVAAPGGTNTFRCSAARCAVLQIASQRAGTNTALCGKTSGSTQRCRILQVSSSANNKAVVYETISNSKGLSQTARSTVSIMQRAYGPASIANSNTACVYQAIALARSGKVHSGPVNLTQAAHQTVTIRQDSKYGGNSAAASATRRGQCTGDAILQRQTLDSNLTGQNSISQKQNAKDTGANVIVDIEQNQSPGFRGTAHGANSADFSQYSALTAIANTAGGPGPVAQWQSSVHGGLLGTINQDSRDVSTALTTQTEIQCEDAAATTGLKTCDTSDPDAATGPLSLSQTQIGPVHKGVGTATQTGNAADTFSIQQSSTQNDDQGPGSQQENNVQGDCVTDGGCTLFQLLDIDGQDTSNTESGQNLNHTVDCHGTNCIGGGGGAPRR